VGGCAASLLITDEAIPDMRLTLDVDFIIDVMSLSGYHKIESQLRERGFKQVIGQTDSICRWLIEDIMVDVMPTKTEILGFGNRWYQGAVSSPESFQLDERIEIFLISAPYFLATKLEAFKDRGNNDFFASHDMEDIISIVDGRIELQNEIMNVPLELKKYLANEFKNLLSKRRFRESVSGHLPYGFDLEDRLVMAMRKLEFIANMLNKHS